MSRCSMQTESVDDEATTTTTTPLLQHYNSIQYEVSRYTESEPESEAVSQSDLETPTHDPPDGGLRAWSVVLGSWCASFCSFGWINSISEFQRYYRSELLRDCSASQIAWIPSLQVFFMMGMGPIVGILYDRLGPTHLLMAGTSLHIFGLLMLSNSTTYLEILLWQGVCSAIGVSAILQPSLNVIPGWFLRRRGAAFGVLATGSSVGGVIFPIVISRVTAQVGFNWAMRACAALISVLMVVACLTIKAVHLPIPRTYSLKRFCLPMTEPRFRHLVIGLFLFTFGFYIPMGYISSEATAGGTPAHWATYLVSVLNATSFCGRIGSGVVADKVGRYNVFIVVCYLTGFCILVLWTAVDSIEARITFAALFGFFSGAYVTLLPALVHQISPLPDIGLRTGLVYLACSIGGLTTNPIGGLILESSGGWVRVKVFAGFMCFFGTCFIVAARLCQSVDFSTVV